MPDHAVNRQFDFLVVGGGASGAVLARRLAERTGYSVALLEAGSSDRHVPEIADFRRYQDVIAGPHAKNFVAMSGGAGGHLVNIPTGRVLGGSTSLNTCIWLRPPAHDFAAWRQSGASGWSDDAVTDAFRQVEQQIRFETVRSENPAQRALLDAARELDFQEIDFTEPFDAGIGRYRFNTAGYSRQSSAVAFLHDTTPLVSNLKIFTDTEVERLLIDAGHRVTGVQTNRGIFEARYETILCAGAINTPKIMLLSGLGPGSDLQALGIQVFRELAGVGRHLLDHPAVALNLAASREPPRAEPWNYAGILFARTDATAPWPDIEIQLGAELFQKHAIAAGYTGHDGPGFCAYLTVNRACSEGSVTLRSPRADEAPLIDLAYFSDPRGEDMRVMADGLKLSRRLFATRAMQSWIAGEVTPGASAMDGEGLADYIRRTATTGYHLAGTCRMGDRTAPGSVVGSDLKVIGVEGLRIADASIFPTMVSVNIAPTCWMIGQRAADIIRACWSGQAIPSSVRSSPSSSPSFAPINSKESA